MKLQNKAHNSEISSYTLKTNSWNLFGQLVKLEWDLGIRQEWIKDANFLIYKLAAAVLTKYDQLRGSSDRSSVS